MHSRINRISLEEAFSLLSQEIKAKPLEAIDVESAVGRVLAENIVSREDVPKWPISEVDGYALRADSRVASYSIVGKSGPGERFSRPLTDAECIRILTGSYLPEGTDTVIPQEDVAIDGTSISIKGEIPRGGSLMKSGYEYKKGELIAGQGSRITPSMAAFLAYLRIDRVLTYSTISVGIISVGSELTTMGKWIDGKVVNSNYISLMGSARSMGLIPKNFGIVRDDVTKISEKIRTALRKCDIVVMSGGSSVGDTDMVFEALHQIKSKYIFHGLKLKPGRTAGVAIMNGKPIVSVSGNIQAATIELMIVVGEIARLLSGGGITVKRMTCMIDRDIELNTKPGYKSILWLKLYQIGNQLFGSPLMARSPMKSIVMRADGFCIVESPNLRSGENIETILLN
ncbi:MAG: molybdopterin molybdotransferase MoeA [Nitrososphaerota archaeon]|nr:molybdopterin molybdotransferase MoeA [Nitrososphaerota archaeon]MDG7047569.1 molybdopterin molybdotransferase MoeA [Nitrososphaerota archaeon]